MAFLRLAWKNLWRNRRRTLITLSALSLSLTLGQAHQNLTHGFFVNMVDKGVRAGSGHLVISRQAYLPRRDEKLSFSANDLFREVAARPSVLAALPRVYLSGLAQSSRESRGILLAGVDPATEFRINPYLKDILATSQLRASEPSDAMVGSRLATELGLTSGSKFVVTLQNREGQLVSELFRVRGIVRTGLRDVDRSLVMINYQQAAALAGMQGEIHEYAVVLNHADEIDEVQADIEILLAARPGLKLSTWEEAMPGIANAMRLNSGIQSFEIALLLVIITIGVVNTLLMSVMERVREFGIIQAMGGTPGWLYRLIFTEALLLGITGVVVGTLLGILATCYLARYGLDLRPFLPDTMEFGGVVYDPVIYAEWSVVAMLRLALYLLGLSLVASIYPARNATRITPVDAMRHC